MNDKHRRVIRRAVADLFVFSLVISVLMLATPLYLLQIYDRVLASASVDTLLFLSMIVLVALIANGVVDEIRARYADRLALSIDKAMASGAFAASLAGPGAAAGDPGPLRDLATIRQFLTSRVAFSLFDLPFAPLFLVVLFLIHPLLCLIASAGTILLVVIAIFNRMATREEGVVAQRESVLAAATAQAFARNQETVKALGMQAAASEAWGKHFGASVLSANRVAGINSRFGGASRTLRQILQSAILGAGAWLVLSHQMTAGMIFASSIISGRALMPIDQIINGWRPIMDAFAAWKRLKQAVGDKAAATDAAATSGSGRADNGRESRLFHSRDPGIGATAAQAPELRHSRRRNGGDHRTEPRGQVDAGSPHGRRHRSDQRNGAARWRRHCRMAR